VADRGHLTTMRHWVDLNPRTRAVCEPFREPFRLPHRRRWRPLPNAKAAVNTARLTLFASGARRHKAEPNLRLICRVKCLIYYNQAGAGRRRPRHLLCLRRPAIGRQIESRPYNRRRSRDAIDKIEKLIGRGRVAGARSRRRGRPNDRTGPGGVPSRISARRNAVGRAPV